MKIKFLSAAAAILTATGALMAFQMPRMGGNMRMYDPATELTVTGTVAGVANATRGAMMGTHLSVKTATGLATVALGPSSFLSSSGFSFARGDEVEITGSKVTMGGTEWIVAREIVKDGKTLILRDKAGKPRWAQGMMGRGSAATQ